LRFNLVLNNLLSKEKSGALVRISTPVIGDGDDADSRLVHFLDDFVPLFKKYL
jgi:hypothetical protein